MWYLRRVPTVVLVTVVAVLVLAVGAIVAARGEDCITAGTRLQREILGVENPWYCWPD